MNALRAAVLQAAGTTARLAPAWMRAAAYKVPLFSDGVRRVLTWVAPEGRAVVVVAAGIAAGVRLRLDLKTEKYYWLGAHEAAVQQALALETKPGMTVYDVGAHLGFFTLGLARLVGAGGRVVAFDPLPENIRALRENLALNPSLTSNVQVVQAAVANVSGQLRFYGGSDPSRARLAPLPASSEDGQEVASLTLDEFVFHRGAPAPQLVKLDVEGAEGMALQGARRVLREIKPLWILEMHGAEAAQAVWEELRCADYKLLSLNRAREFQAPEEFTHSHLLAVPR
jgi:FkbM family methyltransferase